jgi:hypothetical protein
MLYEESKRPRKLACAKTVAAKIDFFIDSGQQAASIMGPTWSRILQEMIRLSRLQRYRRFSSSPVNLPLLRSQNSKDIDNVVEVQQVWCIRRSMSMHVNSLMIACDDWVAVSASMNRPLIHNHSNESSYSDSSSTSSSYLPLTSSTSQRTDLEGTPQHCQVLGWIKKPPFGASQRHLQLSTHM